MDNLKSVRWKQRFNNLKKAFGQLEKGKNIIEPSDIEIQGIIQSFEFTFELSWKTMKDFLESQGVDCNYPREVLKMAFHHNIVTAGETWLEMLSKRNLLAHTYDEKIAQSAYDLITKEYFEVIKSLVIFFENNYDK